MKSGFRESKVYAFFFEISTELTVLKIGDLCITLSTPHVQRMLLSFYIYKYIGPTFSVSVISHKLFLTCVTLAIGWLFAGQNDVTS